SRLKKTTVAVLIVPLERGWRRKIYNCGGGSFEKRGNHLEKVRLRMRQVRRGEYNGPDKSESTAPEILTNGRLLAFWNNNYNQFSTSPIIWWVPPRPAGVPEIMAVDNYPRHAALAQNEPPNSLGHSVSQGSRLQMLQLIRRNRCDMDSRIGRPSGRGR
ncbi:unnamed protein product, partial [Nesidiocoris tenuis]